VVGRDTIVAVLGVWVNPEDGVGDVDDVDLWLDFS